MNLIPMNELTLIIGNKEVGAKLCYELVGTIQAIFGHLLMIIDDDVEAQCTAESQ